MKSQTVRNVVYGMLCGLAAFAGVVLGGVGLALLQLYVSPAAPICVVGVVFLAAGAYLGASASTTGTPSI